MFELGYDCWRPLKAEFVCPDSFPVVHLVEGGQPVCMLGVAVMADATWLVVVLVWAIGCPEQVALYF